MRYLKIQQLGLGEGRAIPKTMHKKMDVEDFQRVEQELQRHLPKHNGTQSIVSVRQHLPSTSDDGLMNQTIGLSYFTFTSNSFNRYEIIALAVFRCTVI